MSIADLPYRIEKLKQTGQYAFLGRPTLRKTQQPVSAIPPLSDEKIMSPPQGHFSSSTLPEKMSPPPAPSLTDPAENEHEFPPPPPPQIEQPIITTTNKLKVFRNVTLCDGPALWEFVKKQTSEEYFFYTTLRVFATKSHVEDYISSQEFRNYYSAVGQSEEKPILSDNELIITQENYSIMEALIIEEYKQFVTSQESLECLVREFEIFVGTNKIEGEQQQPPEKKVKKSGKSKMTLKEQLVIVQSKPSKLIDVSNFGDTFKNQKGKFLDRIKNASRISKCVMLNDLTFPIVSDNLPAFERAMNSLGSARYTMRIQEFKAKLNSRITI